MKAFWIIIGILSLMFLSFFFGRGVGLGTYGIEETFQENSNNLNTNKLIIQFFANRTFIGNNGLTVDCSDLDLELTSMCVSYYTNQIFNYSLTDDSVSLSEYELRRVGGDCKDWTEFGQREFSKYGYPTYKVQIKVLDPVIEDGIAVELGLDHVFLIVNDDWGYCVSDMTQYKCFSYRDIISKRF